MKRLASRNARRRCQQRLGLSLLLASFVIQGIAVVAYSTDRAPYDREELRAELEARPDGPALIYHECRRISREWD